MGGRAKSEHTQRMVSISIAAPPGDRREYEVNLTSDGAYGDIHNGIDRNHHQIKKEISEEIRERKRK